MNDHLDKDTLDLDKYPTYLPNDDKLEAIQEVLKTFEKGRKVLNKGYNYFAGNSLYEVIDDWTKRWNGYVPTLSPLLDKTQSNIFINFTRNAIISYLAKVAMSPVKSHILAVNKKTGMPDKKFAAVLEDLNQFSLNAENAPQKFLAAALECVTKGTVVVYEGYAKQEQKMKSPLQYDATTGKIKYKEETRVIFDNCFQQVVPLEDFYLLNPFQPDVQKQPKIIWRSITTYEEAAADYRKYKDWEYVQPGKYTLTNEINTFYRDALMTDLQKDQVEVLRYYCRHKNRHIIMVNGIILYDGPIPFKDGKYPFAKTVNEPFANDFFWGNGHPNKYMGEQDLINTFVNAMADKTLNSLLPTGLSSDLDDLIEDDSIEMGKFRKVADINKWKWFEAPQVNTGEMNMLQTVMQLARESANTDAGGLTTPRGGKMQTRQILLKQQEVMQKLSFNMNFLEDLERDRTELRISHILQFYSIPKIEKITGKKGKEIEQLVYRDVQIPDAKLSDGKNGTRIIRMIDADAVDTADKKRVLQDEMSVQETQGEVNGTPVEVLALVIDTFTNFNNMVQVVKYSSYEKNSALEQASRQEYASWLVQMAQIGAGVDINELVSWVSEAYDVDTERFLKPAPPQQAQMPGQQQVPQMGQQTKQLAPTGQSAAGMA